MRVNKKRFLFTIFTYEIYSNLRTVAAFFMSIKNNIRFKHAQPKMLKSSATINPNFIGTFVIEKVYRDTITLSKNYINEKAIDSNLIIKNWGNYMFVNEKDGEYFKLSVAKISKYLDEEKIDLIYPYSEKFNKIIESSELDINILNVDSINAVIKQSYSHDFDIRFYVDTANVYIDDINFNQLQQLLKLLTKLFANRL